MQQVKKKNKKKNSCNQREANLRVADSCPRTNPPPHSVSETKRRGVWSSRFKEKGALTTWSFSFSLNQAYSRQVGFLFFSLLLLFLLKHNSLNIGCGIKGVTNQADGERCHTVSVLQGRWLSLRKPTSSAVTSNSGGNAGTCGSTPAHAGTHTRLIA